MARPRVEDQRKEQIRAAALRCFIRHGYTATRLLDIANEAGMSKGGVYFHFHAKEELFLDIIELHLTSLRTLWRDVPVQDLSPDMALMRLVEVHMRNAESRPNETRLFNLLVTMAVQDDAFRARLREAVIPIQKVYEEVLRRGIETGRFIKKEPRMLAVAVLSFLTGTGSMSAIDKNGRLPVEVTDACELVMQLVRSPVSLGAAVYAVN